MIRVYSYGPLALLCAVAIVQLFNSQVRSLTPWKGGGFGMFASIDAPSIRHWVDSGGTEYFVPLDPRLDRRYMVAMKMPVERHLMSVAEGLVPIVEQKVTGPYAITVGVAGVGYDLASHSLAPFEHDLGGGHTRVQLKGVSTESRSSNR